MEMTAKETKDMERMFLQSEQEYTAEETAQRSALGQGTKAPVYGSPNFTYFMLENFIYGKFEKGISTYKLVDKKVWIRKESTIPFLNVLAAKFGMTICYRTDVLLRGEKSFVEISVNNDEFDKIEVFSSCKDEASEIEKIADKFQCLDQKVSVRWIYNAEGRSVDLIEDFQEQVSADLYPYIKDFDTFVERFQASKSNILLLIGEPGTGKTTFIKNMLAKMNKLCYLTYDEKVLNNDYTFASYMEDDEAGAFVIEDADLFLKSRSDGNGMVSRFLNVGDGLIKLQNKKLIFSTNLPNIKDIDAALVRPGRCFDIINFSKLTREEAQVVADNRNILLPGETGKKDFTLAEIFNNPVQKPAVVSRSFGFC